jgi:hypothetical protein
MNEDDTKEFNRRRRQRSIITACLLVALVGLFYFITLARIQGAGG